MAGIDPTLHFLALVRRWYPILWRDHRPDVEQEAVVVGRLVERTGDLSHTSRAAYRMYRDYGYSRQRQRHPRLVALRDAHLRAVAPAADSIDLCIDACEISRRAGSLVELMRQGHDRSSAAATMGISLSRVTQLLRKVREVMA